MRLHGPQIVIVMHMKSDYHWLDAQRLQNSCNVNHSNRNEKAILYQVNPYIQL